MDSGLYVTGAMGKRQYDWTASSGSSRTRFSSRRQAESTCLRLDVDENSSKLDFCCMHGSGRRTLIKPPNHELRTKTKRAKT